MIIIEDEVRRVVVGGIYRHFKGGVYQVYDLVNDEANRGKVMVCYVNLLTGEKWCRQESLFLSNVDAEKYPEFKGQKRLEYVGNTTFVLPC